VHISYPTNPVIPRVYGWYISLHFGTNIAVYTIEGFSVWDGLDLDKKVVLYKEM